MSHNSHQTEDLFSYLFTENRTYWWNPDFLELIAERWNFECVKKVLDVGCGIGNWGRILAPHFSDETVIYGVDIDPRYIENAKQIHREKRYKTQFQYLSGGVEHLDFQENSFDIVTCQTLLIHVPNIELAIEEMLRVLKPGGRIIIAEPLNMVPMISCNPQLPIEMIDEYFESAKFDFICHRGKQTVGDGSMSATDDLPDVLLKFGITEIQSYLSDKISLMTPPFKSLEEQSWISDLKNNSSSEIMTWRKDQTRKYFISGGGDPNDFDIHWKRATESSKDLIDRLHNQSESYISSRLICLLSGIK